ncbi:PilN domain-containing protein [Massilia sp. CF038]|uniref:PilN domain-containing protein n=1 Tax=Massilia sp. CF038 TaxID=1881045 RepID=UPI0009156A92|nr:PilN domain-containing protein [Massilia sp. CF038]SHG98082.1 Fimbrial assembly protein (PilN) [Massilia sp. CF038]
MSQQINLFNPIFRKQKKYFSSVTMLQSLGLICLGCALLAADAAYRMRSLKAQAAATDALLVNKQQRLADAKVQYPPRPKSTTLSAEITTAQNELTMLSEAADTVQRGGFGDTRGFSPYFRAFARQKVDGLWLTELRVAGSGNAIGVQGNALNAELVPQYLQRLAREPVMKGATFSTLEIGTPETDKSAGAATPRYLSFSLQSSLATAAAAPEVVK